MEVGPTMGGSTSVAVLGEETFAGAEAGARFAVPGLRNKKSVVHGRNLRRREAR